MYQDGNRYWYSTQPTVTKLAEDRAEQYKRDPDRVTDEIERRLRTDVRQTGEFSRAHLFPESSTDVPDDLDARLVVLGVSKPHAKSGDSPSLTLAEQILESRGGTPRLYRNTLVFLAAHQTGLSELGEAVRRYLAWESTLAEKDAVDLSPFQVLQAEERRKSADSTVTARLPETYQWLLVPVQSEPQAETTWQAVRLTGNDALAVRASKRLRNDELLVTEFAGTRLRMEMDRVPLWRGDHVAVRQLVEDFARYLYLPRLKDPSMLVRAARTGLALMTWRQDSFAYAEDYDERAGRYRGLRVAQPVDLPDSDPPDLLVKPEVAERQLEAEPPPPGNRSDPQSDDAGTQDRPTTPTSGPATATRAQPKRFYGSVELDPTRVGRDAGRVAEKVIAHLVALPGAKVTVTLEIDAKASDSIPENVERVVTENSRTLKFTSYGFEQE